MDESAFAVPKHLKTLQTVILNDNIPATPSSIMASKGVAD
jgi:hypothetical protein